MTHRLVVPPECLTPLCFTLQHLKLDQNLRLPRGRSKADILSDDGVVAFALRHFPLLQDVVAWGGGRLEPRPKVLKMLHESLLVPNSEVVDSAQIQFEQLCREAVQRQANVGHLSRLSLERNVKTPAAFSGNNPTYQDPN